MSFRGDKRSQGSMPKPVNLYHFSTEGLSRAKDFDTHIALFREKFGDMRLLNELIGQVGNSASLVLYWWTTEPWPFKLSNESLRTLSSVDTPCDFNLAIYDE